MRPQKILLYVTAILVTAACAYPQPFITTPTKKDDGSELTPIFPSPSWFRRSFGSPSPHVQLKPPARLHEYVQDGKLELSLRDFIDLVMANNTDIEIQRTTIEIQKNAIMRAFAPFDPTLQGSFTATRTVQQTTNALQGALELKQLNQPITFTYNQTLQSGTQFSVGYTTTKLSTNDTFQLFNPSLSGQMVLGFTQPLIRNRGSYITKLPITIARTRYAGSKFTMIDQVTRLLFQAEGAYWDVVGARETLRVQEKALELNAEALKRSRRELELGAISPLDIYQPEANYASAEIQVSQAKFRLQQLEDALRRQISADLDPTVRDLPVVLTETVLPPSDTLPLDREGYVNRALANRPDLLSTRNNLMVDDLQIRRTTNALRPDLSLRGGYTTTGRSGDYYPRPISVGGISVPVAPIYGGYTDLLEQVFGFNYPVYTFGLTLRLPIRDRAAASDLADAMVNKRLNALRQRSLEQQARLEVLNAVNQVEASRANVKLAVVARDLAQKQLDAEQKKYDLGTTVIFFVLDAQTRLVNAEAQLVNQTVQYRRNLLSLLRVTGELLNERGVVVQ
jgi:outer membrane protein TolC